MQKKFIFILIIFILIISISLIFVFGRKPSLSLSRITLEYWRVFDGPDVFEDVIAKYTAIHPNITINYKKLRYEEYEQALLEGFARDRGPDILSIHNTWMNKYQQMNLISAMPDKITMVYPVERGSIKKEIYPEQRTINTLSLRALKNNYVDTVYGDVVIKTKDEESGLVSEKIYGLPLALDTLSMYYNKSLFNNAGITAPPAYWNREFQQAVKKLTKQDNKGQLIQSGVALGGSANIERSSDILSVLMMQNGAVMMENGEVKFHQRPENSQNRDYNPGADALRFYTDFANPAKEVYSWNNSMDNSLEMFKQGKLAMMFGYSYMWPDIVAAAPKLNFDIAKLPQIENNQQNVNFANYWIETVSEKSQNKNAAWDFILYITAAEQAQNYLEKTDKPTALRALVNNQLEQDEVGVFASQVLTAKSWYHGNDANASDAIMEDMVDQAVAGQDKLENIVSLEARKIQQTVVPQKF